MTHHYLLFRDMRNSYKKEETAEQSLIKKLLYRESVHRKYKVHMQYAKQKTWITEICIRKKRNISMTKQTMLKLIFETGKQVSHRLFT